MERLHPLYTDIARPKRLNNPMGYVPHPLCQQAAAAVQRYIATKDEWQEELSRGKMFGVLVVEDERRQLGFLAAYSGLLAERNDWSYFVPAVFDFQQEDGYFKQEEAKISAINRQVEELEHQPELLHARERLTRLGKDMEQDITSWKTKMEQAKRQRDERRQDPSCQEEELIRESQWMKAELKRKRQHHQQAIAAQEAAVNGLEEKIKRFRTQRKEMSDALQRWLFEHFMMRNAIGQSQNLLQIFKDTSTPTPPSGSGECCAPKLFQYAFSHHLRPISIAEFWWGQSPVGEIREHLHFYPACRGKCLPILQYMLQGLDIEENHHEKPSQKEPEIEYEDEWLMVVRKPEGVLSVPGKVGEASVWSFVRSHCPEATGPLIVHRLDMATSGLLVIAKESSVHKSLQEQFKNREIQKTYVALLEREAGPTFPSCGRIHLPLSAMPTDRPRQKVDFEHGRQAVTDYTFITPDRIQLHPLTGRTHQLRVHCAHPKGIGIPIKGDTLYGTPADRLYLHAETLRFRHPVTQEVMAFTWKAEF